MFWLVAPSRPNILKLFSKEKILVASRNPDPPCTTVKAYAAPNSSLGSRVRIQRKGDSKSISLEPGIKVFWQLSRFSFKSKSKPRHDFRLRGAAQKVMIFPARLNIVGFTNKVHPFSMLQVPKRTEGYLSLPKHEAFFTTRAVEALGYMYLLGLCQKSS